MTDIQQLADEASKKYQLDHAAALTLIRDLARQVEAYDGVALDEDDIPRHQAEFILGALGAAQDTMPPAELDAITEHAQRLDQLGAEVATERQLRDKAIYTAATAGHRYADIQEAAGLSANAVGKILKAQRGPR